MEKQRVRIKVMGKVQGVGYRFFTQRSACTLGIKGFVENEPDGSVIIEAEGDKNQLEQFLIYAERGPNWAHVVDVQKEEIPPRGDDEFIVR